MFPAGHALGLGWNFALPKRLSPNSAFCQRQRALDING